MSNSPMARADLVTGLVLFALSTAVIYGAWTMPRLELRQIHPLSAPGLTPGLLGIALALTSLMLIGKAVTSRVAPDSNDLAEEANPGAAFRLGIAAILCLAYALGLIGRIPFWLATSLFVTAFILVFEWPEARPRGARMSSLAWAVAIGFCTGIGVAYAFSELFLVRLP